MPHHLPPTAVKYSQSTEFTETTIPDALQREHSTKPTVWGQIVVSSGTLLYMRQNKPARTVTAEETATIYPEEPHCVASKGPVTFRVEFYRVPTPGVIQ